VPPKGNHKDPVKRMIADPVGLLSDMPAISKKKGRVGFGSL
jgi:hypothetical protein